MIDGAVSHKKRFLDALKALCAAFEKNPSADLLRAYAIGLEGLSIEQIETAVWQAIRGKRFFPRPVELRELIGQAPASERTLQAVALEAFECLAETLRRVGTYQSIEFDDPVLAKIVDQLGGWVYLGSLPESRFYEFTRPAFVKSYVALAAARHPIPPRRLVGLIEQTNETPGPVVRIRTGFHPALIGSPPERFTPLPTEGQLPPIAARVRLAYHLRKESL